MKNLILFLLLIPFLSIGQTDTTAVKADSVIQYQLPPVLFDKIRASFQELEAIERTFNLQIEAYITGFLADKPPVPVGYRPYIDPAAGVLYFRKEGEK